MNTLLSIMLVLFLLPMHGTAKAPLHQHDVDLWNVVNPLNTTVTFLNTGAHPDDERSDLLAYLSRGLGIKTASLIANRGEGGQNEIGSELGDGLGIIRSNEMIEAAGVTGVKAYHLSQTTSDPIYDFGFSKSPEETLEKWGEDLTYERFIRFIREYQPDIVMPSFRNVANQHGHHRAATILSERAFEDAANPNIYPEHLEEGLSTWQMKKFYLPAASAETATTSIEIGDYDPIYDMSYPQIGEASRYLHKSQGMGRDVPVEPRQFHLELVGNVTDGEDEDLFSGIPYNFYDWAEIVPNQGLHNQLTKLQQKLDTIVDSYPNREVIFSDAHQALKDVKKVTKKVGKSELDPDLKHDLLHKLEIKEEQLNEVSLVASGLDVETTLNSPVLTQGEQTTATVKVENKGAFTVKHIDLAIAAPSTWEVDKDKHIKKILPGETITFEFNVIVPEEEKFYHPYEEPILQTNLSIKEKGEVSENALNFTDTVAVLPDVSLTTKPANVVINTADMQDFYTLSVEAKNYVNGTKEVDVSLDLPEGWQSEPVEHTIKLDNRFDTKEIEFSIIPPEDVKEGELDIHVKALSDGKKYDSTIQEITYDHINHEYFQYPTLVHVASFELLKPGNLKVGYIESGFDEVADYLINVGFDVTKLKETDLSSADLSEYDTIVTGIRANLARADLIANNERLKEYARNGGHVVFQYHKPGDNWDINETLPYSLELGMPSIEWRVTDETAPVTMTKPDHPLFNYPNKITDADWDGWVQERGLYFPMNWDDRYETFVSMADPNEDPFDGGILMAEYGEGTYLYTNLVFYRQIANQVSGGYRIFTNLISYGHETTTTASTVNDIQALVEKFARQDTFENKEIVQALQLHLTAVSHYEKEENTAKLVKHMNGFKELLDYQKEHGLISVDAYESLHLASDSLIANWEQ
ncbi:PIG-L family deacetylase [Virgibacillus soli]|uniref:FIMAH domain-containing protein n=1 Tax=Paracerasibacillus soli TaxID=480284 RepID=UPI0035E99B7A